MSTPPLTPPTTPPLTPPLTPPKTPSPLPAPAPSTPPQEPINKVSADTTTILSYAPWSPTVPILSKAPSYFNTKTSAPTTAKSIDYNLFKTVENSKDTVEAHFVLETTDDVDIVTYTEVLHRNSNQDQFYINIAKIVKKLHDDNSHLQLIHGFNVYKCTALSYTYHKLYIFFYDKFWPTKTAKDVLIISNHVYGNGFLTMTPDMKTMV